MCPDLIENAWTHSSRCVCVADDEWSDGKPRLPGSDPNGECASWEQKASFLFLSRSLSSANCAKLFISLARSVRPQGWHFYCARRVLLCIGREMAQTHKPHIQGGLDLGPLAHQPNGQINIYFPAIKGIAPNKNRSNCDGSKQFFWSNLICVLFLRTGNRASKLFINFPINYMYVNNYL